MGKKANGKSIFLAVKGKLVADTAHHVYLTHSKGLFEHLEWILCGSGVSGRNYFGFSDGWQVIISLIQPDAVVTMFDVI